MIIRYANGTTVDVALLSENEGVLKLAVKGVEEQGSVPAPAPDPMMFHTLPGACFASSHESVQIEMRTEAPRPVPPPAPILVPEPRTHSSKDLAAWMLRLVLSEEAMENEDTGVVESRLDEMGLPRDLQHSLRLPWAQQSGRDPRHAAPARTRRGSDLLADLHQQFARVASA